MRLFYLILAVVGAIVPMMYFLPWLSANGWDLGAMVEAWNVSDATTGLVYDLTIAAVAVAVAAVVHAVRAKQWAALVCVPVTVCIGVSCALPLLLWFREGRR